MRIAIIAQNVLNPYRGIPTVVHNTLRGFLKIQSELEKKDVEIVFLSINDKVSRNYGRISVRTTKRIPPISFTGEVQALLSKPKENFEIIHSHSLYDIFPWLLKKDVAKIFQSHGIFWKLRDYSNLYGKFWIWLYEKRLRFYYPKFTKFVAVSKYIIEEFNRKGFETSKAVVIENPVGDEFFEIEKNEERIILYPAALSRAKNQLGFLKALAMIKREIKDLKVVFAGGGDEAYMKELKEFVEKKDLTVVFAGNVPYEKMPDLYSTAFIVTLVSFEEATPMAIAEAMATGTPILASNVGGVPYMIKNGKNGLMVDPNDPRDIAEKLLILIEDENLRKRLGENAKKEAERRWRCEIIARKLLDLYLEVLENC